MPYKDKSVRKKKHQEYSRKHYEANTEEVKKRTAEKKKQFRVEWDAFKRTLKCAKCGFSHPAALDFHHIDPTQKDRAVSFFHTQGQFKRAYQELEKCMVLCANCHRILHYEERKNPAL